MESLKSISEMAKILNMPHNSSIKYTSAILREAKKAGYEYKDLGFVKVVPAIVHPHTMSPAAFKSMVSRNNMTPESVEALRGSLERGKRG